MTESQKSSFLKRWKCWKILEAQKTTTAKARVNKHKKKFRPQWSKRRDGQTVLNIEKFCFFCLIYLLNKKKTKEIKFLDSKPFIYLLQEKNRREKISFKRKTVTALPLCGFLALTPESTISKLIWLHSSSNERQILWIISLYLMLVKNAFLEKFLKIRAKTHEDCLGIDRMIVLRGLSSTFSFPFESSCLHISLICYAKDSP